MGLNPKLVNKLEMLSSNLNKEMGKHHFTTHMGYTKNCDCCQESRERVYCFSVDNTVYESKLRFYAMQLKGVRETYICEYCMYGLISDAMSGKPTHVFFERALLAGLFSVRPIRYDAPKEMYRLADSVVMYMSELRKKGYTVVQDSLDYLTKPELSKTQGDVMQHMIVYLYILNCIHSGKIKTTFPNAEIVPFAKVDPNLENLVVTLNSGTIIHLKGTPHFKMYIPEFLKYLSKRILDYKEQT